MKKVINLLRDEAYIVKYHIGLTPTTDFKGTQKDWDKEHRELSKMLFKAARILEATL